MKRSRTFFMSLISSVAIGLSIGVAVVLFGDASTNHEWPGLAIAAGLIILAFGVVLYLATRRTG